MDQNIPGLALENCDNENMRTDALPNRQNPSLPTDEAKRQLREKIRDIWRDIPDEVRAGIPTDGASQVDHYVYGVPKRDR